jgi:hypothetical protein
MAKIVYDPLNTLVIHDVVKVSLDDLMRERVIPSGTMPLYWCNGFLFSFASPPMVDEIVKDYMEGKVHWMEVHYCELTPYQQILDLKDEHYGSAPIKIRVIDTSRSPLHGEFIKWLKSSKL